MGLAFHDTEFRFVRVNEALASLNGVPIDQTIGRSLQEVIPQLAAEVYELLCAAQQSRQPILNVEVVGRTNASPEHDHYFLSSFFPVQAPDGTLLGSGIIVMDVTQQKQIERRLRESEAKFRSVFENAAIGMALVSPDGRQVQVNRAYCEMVGYSEKELLGRHYQDITHPEDQAQDREFVRQFETGEITTADFEKRLIHNKGSTVWVRITVSLLRVDHKPLYYVVQIHDLSQTRQALAVLQRTQEEQRARAQTSLLRLAAIVESSDSAIYSIDTCGEIVSWNYGASVIFGYSEQETLGQMKSVLVPPERMDESAGILNRVLKGKHVRQLETVRTRKDGKPVHVLLSATPLIDNQGRVTGAALTCADVSQRKLLEDQMRQAQKMEAIGHLAGGVAHDFNNLLTVINGYSELILAKRVLNHADAALLHEVTKAGERAANLTRQLLAFSRKQMMLPTVLDLNAVIADLEKMLRRLIGEDVHLLCNLKPNLPHVKVDRGQIEQVVMNLVVNARDAMPRGGHLRIATQAVNHSGLPPGETAGSTTDRYVLLSVTDTGAGMDQATLSRIFEPFFTTKEVGKGTGLGLATVHGIVKQSGGTIAVTSEMGKGSTFKIYLPATEDRAPGKSADSVMCGSRGMETLLLVEDDESLRKLSQMLLESQGYVVVTASDGKDALKRLTSFEGRLDLVVTDVVMPHVDGPQLVQELRKRFPHVKPLYVSGYAGDALAHHGLVPDEPAFLQKPFNNLALGRKVRELLDAPSPG